MVACYGINNNKLMKNLKMKRKFIISICMTLALTISMPVLAQERQVIRRHLCFATGHPFLADEADRIGIAFHEARNITSVPCRFLFGKNRTDQLFVRCALGTGNEKTSKHDPAQVRHCRRAVQFLERYGQLWAGLNTS